MAIKNTNSPTARCRVSNILKRIQIELSIIENKTSYQEDEILEDAYRILNNTHRIFVDLGCRLEPSMSDSTNQI
ncbi:MAG: hypothetical protein WBB01_15825 [Phormidesmis sp.]